MLSFVVYLSDFRIGLLCQVHNGVRVENRKSKINRSNKHTHTARCESAYRVIPGRCWIKGVDK